MRLLNNICSAICLGQAACSGRWKLHVSVFLYLLALLPKLHSEATAPNLLIIMTDDQGRWAMGTYDDRIHTPNLDYLAEKGVRFDQAISPVPVCSAARASFMTGRMPSQHGVHDFLSLTDSYPQDWLADEYLLSQALQSKGYQVGLFGKWHANTKGWNPAPGFNQWLSYDGRNADWINQYQHSGTVHFSRNGTPETYTGVQARFLSEEVVRFIDTVQDTSSETPFAVFLNFVEPHFPFAGLPERLVERYRPIAHKIISNGGASTVLRSNGSVSYVADHREQLAQYLASVTLVDEQVGRLWDALHGRDLLRNTVIVFTSDHGHMNGQYGLYGKGNGSLPQNLYQQSINIPLIIQGPPAWVAAGQVRSEFVTLCDLFPTLVEIAGGTEQAASTQYDGPGISLVPLLKGDRPTQFRSLQYAEYGNARMVHNGRWKLVRYYKNETESTWEDHWFDLVHPLGEKMPSQPPAALQVKSFQSALETFFAKYETPEHSGRTIWNQPLHNSMEPWRKK